VATVHHLERSQIVPRPRSEVFAFFASPANLEAITPAFLRFEILPPVPTSTEPGTLIDYRLRLFGVPMRWRTRIASVEEGRGFVDVQLRGPYALWEHLHRFEEVPGGTLVIDRVRYALPFGPVGALVHRLVVRRVLDRIFDARRARVAALLPPGAPGPRPPGP
jgi:ligand-binding SRPBCC domain-containing protein